MKKVITFFLVITFLIGASGVAYAQPYELLESDDQQQFQYLDNTDYDKVTRFNKFTRYEDTIKIDDHDFKLTKDVYHDYAVVSVSDEEGNVSIADSRLDYVLENGKKIFITVETEVEYYDYSLFDATSRIDSKSDNLNIDAIPLATRAYDSWGVNTSKWSLISATKTTVTAEIQLKSIAVATLAALITLKIPWFGVAVPFAQATVEYFISKGYSDKAFYVNRRVYGHYGHLSCTSGQVKYHTTQSGVVIPRTQSNSYGVCGN